MKTGSLLMGNCTAKALELCFCLASGITHLWRTFAKGILTVKADCFSAVVSSFTQGKVTFANGDVYVGQFHDDFQHGSGIMTYADGA
jgi:hypothetical protein